MARRIVAALQAGYRFTISHPAESAADLERLVPGLDPSLVTAQLTALLPAFKRPSGAVGELDQATLRSWAAWEVRFRIVSRSPDVNAMFESLAH
jgi:ABC-type nitrate/sulfonate/bicarbonate transport system substrate-binding protein